MALGVKDGINTPYPHDPSDKASLWLLEIKNWK